MLNYPLLINMLTTVLNNNIKVRIGYLRTVGGGINRLGVGSDPGLSKRLHSTLKVHGRSAEGDDEDAHVRHVVSAVSDRPRCFEVHDTALYQRLTQRTVVAAAPVTLTHCCRAPGVGPRMASTTRGRIYYISARGRRRPTLFLLIQPRKEVAGGA